jgi:hypothetical protein
MELIKQDLPDATDSRFTELIDGYFQSGALLVDSLQWV